MAGCGKSVRVRITKNYILSYENALFLGKKVLNLHAWPPTIQIKSPVTQTRRFNGFRYGIFKI